MSFTQLILIFLGLVRSKSLGALNLLRNMFTSLDSVDSLSPDSDSGLVLVDVSAIFYYVKGMDL